MRPASMVGGAPWTQTAPPPLGVPPLPGGGLPPPPGGGLLPPAPPAVMLSQEFLQVSQQMEATMKQAATGAVPNVLELQAMQGRVAQLMAQYDQGTQLDAPSTGPALAMPRAPAVGPLAGTTLPVAGAPAADQDESTRWVEDQRAELSKAELATKVAALESGAFVGVVARYSSASGIGFIECEETAQQYGGDVQIRKDLFNGLEVGDTVVFQAAVDDNRAATPQVAFVRRLGELSCQRQRILAVEAPSPAPGAVESAQEYIGFVTSFQPDRGFGFVSCAQTRQLYGNDVYIHRDQYVDTNIGDAVHFRVALNPKGVPVARGVRKALTGIDAISNGASMPAAGSAAVAAPPGPGGAEVQNLMAIAGFAPAPTSGSGGGDATAVPPPLVAAPGASRASAAGLPAPDGKAPKRGSRSRSMSQSMSISQSPGRKATRKSPDNGLAKATRAPAPAESKQTATSGQTPARSSGSQDGSAAHGEARRRRRSRSRSRGGARAARSGSRRSISRQRSASGSGDGAGRRKDRKRRSPASGVARARSHSRSGHSERGPGRPSPTAARAGRSRS